MLQNFEAPFFNKDDNTVIIMEDNGSGSSPEIFNRIDILPKEPHGSGLPSTYRIIRVHSGTFTPKNENDFRAEIRLPLKNKKPQLYRFKKNSFPAK